MPGMRLLAFSAVCFSIGVAADDFTTRVAMIERPAATFYAPTLITGYGSAELMVDTGSGYVIINEGTLAEVKRSGQAHYVRQARGMLADGSELDLPVYALSSLSIGEDCWLHNIEVAVFPGDSRQILGLSALRRAAPFVFSVDPPELKLSRCESIPTGDASLTLSEVDTRS